MTRTGSISAAIAVLLFVFTAGVVPAAAQPFIYQASGSSSCNDLPPVTGCAPPNVSVVNVGTGRTIAGVNLGAGYDNVDALALSPDASRVYAVRRVSCCLTVPGVLSTIDAASLTIVRETTVGGLPTDVAIAPGGARVYVTNGGTDSVSVVDTASGAVVTEIHVGVFPTHVVVSPDGAWLYVTNLSDSSVSKISTATNTVTATIALAPLKTPISASLSPDGSHLFVVTASDTPSSAVANVDTASGVVVGTVNLGAFRTGSGVVAASATRVFALFYDRDDGSDSGVAVIDAGSNSIVDTLLLSSPSALAMNSSRSRLFVSAGSNTYSIDATTLAQQVIPARGGVDLELTPDTTPCLFELTPGTGFVPTAGGSGELAIPAPGGCSWTVSTSDPAITFDGSMTGVGPATLTYHVSATTQPRRFDVVVARQIVTIDQTSPVASADVTAVAPVDQPLHVALWFDRDPKRRFVTRLESSVDLIHTWAFPAHGGSAVFVGQADFSLYGLAGQASGFNVPVGNLATGRYTLAFYAHDPRANTFQLAAVLDVNVRAGRAVLVVDSPLPARTLVDPFIIGGWALDPAGAAGGGSGIDAVHIWAYPTSGAAPMFVAQAFTGGSRPDVARLMGYPFSRAGFTVSASLPSGSYTLAVFGRSTATGTFDVVQMVPITVIEPHPLMNLDGPNACPCAAGYPFFAQGWALDLSAPTGTGVAQIQVWATPVGGSQPFYVTNLTSVQRPDVAQAFGPQFEPAGFSGLVFLTSGTYDVRFDAYSVLVPATIAVSRTIRVTIQ